MPTLINDLANQGIHATRTGKRYILYQTTRENAQAALLNPAVILTATYRVIPNGTRYTWTAKEAQRLTRPGETK